MIFSIWGFAVSEFGVALDFPGPWAFEHPAEKKNSKAIRALMLLGTKNFKLFISYSGNLSPTYDAIN